MKSLMFFFAFIRSFFVKFIQSINVDFDKFDAKALKPNNLAKAGSLTFLLVFLLSCQEKMSNPYVATTSPAIASLSSIDTSSSSAIASSEKLSTNTEAIKQQIINVTSPASMSSSSTAPEILTSDTMPEMTTVKVDTTKIKTISKIISKTVSKTKKSANKTKTLSTSIQFSTKITAKQAQKMKKSGGVERYQCPCMKKEKIIDRKQTVTYLTKKYKITKYEFRQINNPIVFTSPSSWQLKKGYTVCTKRKESKNTFKPVKTDSRSLSLN